MRLLAALLLLLPLSASAASLVDCWDGTRWTTGTCPPQLDIVSTTSDATSVSVTYTLAADAAEVFFYVGAPVSGQCVRPAISVIKSGAGAEFHAVFDGADTEVDAGESTVTATGLSADSQYCPHLFAVNSDGIPPETLSVAARERYSKTTPSPVYTPDLPEGTLVKWNPGHYMMQTVGGSSFATRQGHYDAITDSTTIKGAVMFAFWGNLEPTDDNFVWTTIQQELDYLKALNVPKRLFVRIIEKRENPNGCANRTYFPAWVDAAGWCVQTGTERFVLKWWDNALEAEFIELMQAMAAEFDDDPYFEGVVFLRETGIGANTSHAGYTHTAYVQNLKDIASATQAAFVKSNVIMFTNFVPTQGQAAINSLMQWQIDNGIGQGSPDVAPDCITPTLNCPGGWYDPQRVGSGEPGGSPTEAYNFAHENMIGQVPIMWAVESSQLGSDAVGQEGGYSADLIYRFANQYLGASHLFWMRNESYGAASQRWSGTGGILDTINANPTFTNTACPASHFGGDRVGCITGGTE